MRLEIVTTISNSDFEISPDSLERGKKVATYLRSIALACYEAEREMLKLHEAMFYSRMDSLVLIPSKPLETKVISIERLYKKHKAPLGQPRFIGKIMLEEPVRLSQISVQPAGLTVAEVKLSAQSPYLEPRVNTDPDSIAEYYKLGFKLDEHNLAVVDN